MIFGIKTGEKRWDTPKTIQEFLNSKNFIWIIENEPLRYYPDFWDEAYNSRVLGKEGNKYYSKDIPYLNLEKIIKLLKQYYEDPLDIIYKPSKVDSTSDWPESREVLIYLDFDYILYENKLFLYSRKYGKDYYTKLPRYLLSKKDIIYYKLGKEKVTVDLKKKLSITEKYYSESLTDDYLSNFRGTVKKNISIPVVKKDLVTILKQKFSDFLEIYSVDPGIKIKVIPMFSMESCVIKVHYVDNIIELDIQKTSCHYEYDIISKLGIALIYRYELEFQKKYKGEEYESSTVKKMSILRSVNPDLFVKNYSREASVLPIYVRNPEKYKSRLLEYPKDSGNYYGAPDGYFPGLKDNRLSNKDKYPYIINCYKSDHFIIPSKITYKYYNDMKSEKKQQVSIMDIIESKGYLPKNKTCMELTFQEFFDKDPCITKEDLFFRYYEELYGINIIILQNKDILIPDTPKPYFWFYDNNRETIVIEKIKIKKDYTYKLYNSAKEDIIQRKHFLTSKYEMVNTNDYMAQHIDFNGKVRALQRKDGSWIDFTGAPLNLPVTTAENESIRRVENVSRSFFNNLGHHYIEKDIFSKGSQKNYYSIQLTLF